MVVHKPEGNPYKQTPGAFPPGFILILLAGLFFSIGAMVTHGLWLEHHKAQVQETQANCLPVPDIPDQDMIEIIREYGE